MESDTLELVHKAPKLFGRLLDQLMLASLLSQHQLSKQATAIRKELIVKGQIVLGDPLIGGMNQQTISSVIAGQRPTFGQVSIWLDVIKSWYKSPEMFKKVSKVGLERPREFTAELEKNMWRLALFGTTEEIKAAYKECKNVDLLENRPVVQSYRIKNLSSSKSRQDTDAISPVSRSHTDQHHIFSPHAPITDQIHGGVEQIRRAIETQL